MYRYHFRTNLGKYTYTYTEQSVNNECSIISNTIHQIGNGLDTNIDQINLVWIVCHCNRVSEQLNHYKITNYNALNVLKWHIR